MKIEISIHLTNILFQKDQIRSSLIRLLAASNKSASFD